jgi:hypothetical protein
MPLLEELTANLHDQTEKSKVNSPPDDSVNTQISKTRAAQTPSVVKDA